MPKDYVRFNFFCDFLLNLISTRSRNLTKGFFNQEINLLIKLIFEKKNLFHNFVYECVFELKK